MKNLFVIAIMSVLVGTLHAQSGYQQTNRVANTPGIAAKLDPQLSNPWGMAMIAGQPLWIANNNSGTSTLYSSDGTKDALVVQIPVAANNPCNPGCPTGIVGNTTGDFGGASFIFDTEDGLIVSWIQGTTAFTSVDNSAQGAIYKGLALLNSGSGNVLLAANFHTGKIEVYDRSFRPTSLAGDFADPNLPAGLAPFSVHVIGSSIYVAYAVKDLVTEDPTAGAGNGAVNIFDLNGNFVSRLTTGGPLNAPWGVAIAPVSFGQFSNDVLIGNFGDGTINAFDHSGNFMGQLKDGVGNPLVNPGLWELAVGLFNDPQTMYFTAGGADETHGVFGTMQAAQAVNGGDFSLAVSPTNLNLGIGGSSSVMVTAAGMNAFSGNITLSCSGLQPGVSCSFSPSVISPGGGSAFSSLTVSVSQGYNFASVMAGPLSGIFPLGLALVSLTRGRKSGTAMTRGATLALLVMVSVFLLMEAGCGNYGNNRTSMRNSTFTVTGTSGSTVHSSPVTLTVN